MRAKLKDRRTGAERRRIPGKPKREQRVGQRRLSERRDCPRVPLSMMVRYEDLGGSFEERQGDIAVGGCSFRERFAPPGREVQLRFRLPGVDKELRCTGEIIRLSKSDGNWGVHVQFTQLPTAAELLIARFIDETIYEPAE